MNTGKAFSSICIALAVVSIAIMLFVIAPARDKQLLREELIWYSRYQVVEEMYLRGIPDNGIIQILLTEVAGDWTLDEIRKDLEITKSY